MKLEQLFEIRSTQDLENHGIAFDEFGERELFFQDNGVEVYRRIHKNDNNSWLLDINNHAFLLGIVSDTFKGKIKNKLLQFRRVWTDPEHRNTGLITNIMYGLFNRLDYALMSDSILSPSGKASWLKLCTVLPISNCYAVDRTKNTFVPMKDKQTLLNDITNNEDDVEYIIELEVPLVENWEGAFEMGRGPNFLVRHNFEGCI